MSVRLTAKSLAHGFLYTRQQVRYVEVLGTLGKAFAATHTRRGRVAALHRRHGNRIVCHSTFHVAVKQIVVVNVCEDVADGHVVRTRYAASRPDRGLS